MARRFLFTGGTSVIGALKGQGLAAEIGLAACERGEASWLERFGRVEREPATTAPSVSLTAESTDLLSELLAATVALRDFGARCRRTAAEHPARARESLRALGAEGESIARREQSEGPGSIAPLRDDDDITLLATDTVAGVVAAAVSTLTSGRRPEFKIATTDGLRPALPVTDQMTVDPDLPTATVCIVQGMSTGSSRGIEGSSPALTVALRTAAETAAGAPGRPREPRQLIVEFSGGYKAAIPLMLHLLEYLHSIEADTVVPDLSLHFRHEDEPERWLHAPLRRLDQHTLNAHAQELDTIDHGGAAMSETLRGFGWHPETGLTAVGRGALELLRAYAYPRYR